MLLINLLLAARACTGPHSRSAAQEVLIALGLQLTADQEWQLLTASEHPLVANRSPPSAFTSEPFALEPPPPEAAGAAAGAAAAPPAYPGPALPAGRAFRASIVGFGSNGALAAAAAAAAAAAGAAAGPASPERPYQQLRSCSTAASCSLAALLAWLQDTSQACRHPCLCSLHRGNPMHQRVP